MNIAYYAPLKPPYHPIPSGDRRMARLLMQALRRAGHDVTLASRLRSYDGSGDIRRQDRIRRRADQVAQSYLDHADDHTKPDLWFTYHLYHKAPDLLGPRIARALSVPYVVAEASFAPKQAGGPWRNSHAEVETALRQAARIITLNPDDDPCVRAIVKDGDRLTALAPFIDTRDARAAARTRQDHRAAFAKEYNLEPTRPWIAVVAMLRHGDKFDSYKILARIVSLLEETPFHLLIAGDGPARDEIVALFGDDSRIHWLGATPPATVNALNAAADLFVWPAIREAYGMALLEAQAAGTPVIAGGAPGVRQIVAHDETGLIAPMNLATLANDMARDIRVLLSNPDRRRDMGRAALAHTQSHHDIDGASRQLNQIIMEAA